MQRVQGEAGGAGWFVVKASSSSATSALQALGPCTQTPNDLPALWLLSGAQAPCGAGIEVGQPVPRVRPPVLGSSPHPSRVEILYEFGVLYVVTALQVTSQIPGFMLKRY
ncbi:hypothetical protein PAL_GLEAN10014803 [Pteropus alecto]|uniref:Uncharacterized protein n=1 Tax=Pteropus alecto TaxID=9402 RepID=L5KNH3_PTEAL|nr:hypothetical protein PAL_GLEAN10014803 [Pteropus alecto]